MCGTGVKYICVVKRGEIKQSRQIDTTNRRRSGEKRKHRREEFNVMGEGNGVGGWDPQFIGVMMFIIAYKNCFNPRGGEFGLVVALFKISNDPASKGSQP
jgi:hypothetical protein